ALIAKPSPSNDQRRSESHNYAAPQTAPLRCRLDLALLGQFLFSCALLQFGHARFCRLRVRSFRKLIDIAAQLRDGRRSPESCPHQLIELCERIALGRACGKAREMIAQILYIVSILDELPAREFLSLADFIGR